MTIANEHAEGGDRRLIEEWLPINEISVDAIREGGALAGHPPVNQLHVWWARRPLVAARAAVAASMLKGGVKREAFIAASGSSSAIVAERQEMDAAKARGQWSDVTFSNDRAFKHNLTLTEAAWLKDNLAVSDPLVVDITAGGGSIPFEAGRLGLRSIANELNPVAQLILRTTCQWPQQHGYDLLDAYNAVSARFKRRVRELLDGVYPQEPQLTDTEKLKEFKTTRAQRYVWSYLWARVVFCPSCKGEIPLSPNWRLTSGGTGIRLIPDVETGTCSFKVVNKVSEQSPGTVRNAIATCPYPNCGATTPRDYISQEAQAGRLGHQLYCIIYRDQWWPKTKSGKPRKRPKTRRGFRLATPKDENSAGVTQRLEELKPEWDAADILPGEAVPDGDKTTGYPLRYGMPHWIEMFSPRQQLAHGYCVQAFRELVDEDRDDGTLNDTRKAAWSYVALALDKVIGRNSLLARWDPGTNKVASTFDSHDFGMKWSYAEMAVTIEGLGLEWGLDEIGECIQELVAMSGYPERVDGTALLADPEEKHRAVASLDVTGDSADLLLSLESKSVDAIVFDPPYYDNVSYAELSDFFYVWLKRTAGYVHPEWFAGYLTDKTNEAIASSARFRKNLGKRGKSVKNLAYEDYVERMRRIFSECRRVIKDDGIMTIMFTHKTTDAWDALTIGIIDAEFRITATWPVKTESDSSLNIRDRAAARSTILLACRPKTIQTTESSSWERVEREVAAAVRERLPQLEGYDLRPLDIYLASFGPALEVISNNWPIRREMANPQRSGDPFAVTPNDALQVARREVFASRRRHISELWANNPGDPLTEFYILSQDSAGSAIIPFDEANMVARCIGLELAEDPARQIYEKKGSNINLLTGRRRLEQGRISPTAPSSRSIDRVHIAIALAGNSGVNAAIEWCHMQDFQNDVPFKGALEALLRVMRPDDPDLGPARTLWSEMYGERAPEAAEVQLRLLEEGE